MAYIDGGTWRSGCAWAVRRPPRRRPDAHRRPRPGRRPRQRRHSRRREAVQHSLNRRGEPILTDFGAASVGTPAYMAPERLRGEAAGRERAGDVYALGVVLYELLSGRLPCGDDPPPPSAHASGLDPRLDAICLQAIARDSADRFADMAAFAAALAPFCEAARAGRGTRVGRCRSRTESILPPSRGRKHPYRRAPLPVAVADGHGRRRRFGPRRGVAYAWTQYEYLQKRDAPPAAEGPAALLERSRAAYRQGPDEPAFADFAEVLLSIETGAPMPGKRLCRSCMGLFANRPARRGAGGLRRRPPPGRELHRRMAAVGSGLAREGPRATRNSKPTPTPCEP